MAISLVPLTGSVVLPNGDAPVDGVLTFTLSDNDAQVAAVVADGEVTLALEADGDIPAGWAGLWRNSAGVRGTTYAVKLTSTVTVPTLGASSYNVRRTYKLGSIQIGADATYLLAALLAVPVQDPEDWARTARFFATRDQFKAWANSTTSQDGTIVSAAGFTYRCLNGVVDIGDIHNWLPQGNVYPDHWATRNPKFSVNDLGECNDMTAAIRAAWDYTTCVYLTPGIYAAAGLVRKDQRELRGSGWQPCVLALADNSNTWLIMDDAIYNNETGTTQYGGFSNVQFYGNKAMNPTGELLRVRGYKTKFENCRFTQSASHGLWLSGLGRDGVTYVADGHTANIEFCRFDNNTGHGCWADKDFSDFNIAQTDFGSCTGRYSNSLRIENTAGGHLDHCQIFASGGTCAFFSSVGGFHVTNCTFDVMGQGALTGDKCYGVYIEKFSNGEFGLDWSGNTIKLNKAAPVDVQFVMFSIGNGGNAAGSQMGGNIFVNASEFVPLENITCYEWGVNGLGRSTYELMPGIIYNPDTFAGIPPGTVLPNPMWHPAAKQVAGIVPSLTTAQIDAIPAKANEMSGLIVWDKDLKAFRGFDTKRWRTGFQTLADAGVEAVSLVNFDLTAGGLTATNGISFDGVATVADKAYGLFFQTDNKQNGIYIPDSAGVWARADYADTGVKLAASIVPVKRGSVYQGTFWVSTFSTGVTVGVSGLRWYPLPTEVLASFRDNAFTLYDNADQTKTAGFQLDQIATGTKRTLTIPNQDGIIVLDQGTLAAGGGLNALAFGTQYKVTQTPTGNRTYTTTVPPAFTECFLQIVTSGTTSYTLTFGSGFVTTLGTITTGTTTGKRFMCRFLSDGVNLVEQPTRVGPY